MGKRFKDAYENAMKLAQGEENNQNAEMTEAEENPESGENVPMIPEAVSAEAENVPPEEAAPESEVPPEEGVPEGGPVPEEEAKSESEETDGAEAGENPGKAAQGEDEIDKLRAEIEALKEENEQLKKAVEDSGRMAAEKIASLSEPPEGEKEAGKEAKYDFSAIIYGDEEEAAAASEKIIESLLAKLEERSRPMMEKYGEAKKYNDREAAAKVLCGMEEMKGFSDMREDLDRLISGNSMLSANENPMESYIAAYLIRKGAQSLTEPSVEDLMSMYHSNTSFRDRVEQERIDALSKSGEVPQSPISSGLSAAEPYTVEHPKTMADAKLSMRRRYKQQK